MNRNAIRNHMLYRMVMMILLASAMAAAVLFPAAVQAEETPAIKVGVLAESGLAEIAEDGTYTGADVEYVYRIAQTAGVKIDLVLFQNLEDSIDALNSGRVDVLFNILRTEQRSANYLFSDYAISSSPMSLYVRTDDARFQEPGWNLSGMTVGTEMGSVATDLFESWAQAQGMTPATRGFTSIAAMNEALDKGEVDACVLKNDDHPGYQTAALFAPSSNYLMLRSDEEALKTQLDLAMEKILNEDSLYYQKLVSKYAADGISGMDPFTQEETDWLQAHTSVKVAVIRNDQPYYSGIVNGRDQGILPDYYAWISSLTGLQFSFVPFEDQASAIEALKQKQVDVLGLYSDSIVTAYDQGISLTSTYASVPIVQITRAGKDPASVVTISAKERTIGLFQRVSLNANPNLKFVSYRNGRESFRALTAGKVDGMLCGQPTATWLINQVNSAAYTVSPISYFTIDLAGAVRSDDVQLCGILDKAIKANAYTFDSIVSENTMAENSLASFMARIPAWLILAVTGLLTLLVLSLVMSMLKLQRKRKEEAALAKEKAETDRRAIQVATAEKANEDRNRFFSSISHDMRTPLNAIINYSGMAESCTDPKKQKDYLEKIQISGRLLVDLVNDTLTISKMNSGKLTLEPQRVDLHQLLETITTAVKEEADRRHITFRVSMDPGDPYLIYADSLNLSKILLNLLTNAVKYTHDGGHVTLQVQTEQLPDGGMRCTFTVSDNGIGMSREFLPHLYEPFVQERRYGKEPTGTGLGLTIVHDLVTMMHGEIQVASTAGVGTSFVVTIPFGPIPDAAAEQAPAREQAAPAVSLQGRKVLLCEDNSMNREIAVLILKEMGIEAESAVNGRLGCERFASSAPGEFSAILMDLRMPVMSGIEAAKTIRAMKRPDAGTIPIIAMTADAFEDDRRACLDAGMNAHVAKPVDPSVLRQTLEEALKNA